MDSIVRHAIAAGYRRSPTFRHLVDVLEASNVIVYAERRIVRRHGGGAISFVTESDAFRYLRITLDAELSPELLVALLGHELQHAVEVAEAPWVVDQASYFALYRAIGRASCAGPRWCFDTPAALAAGHDVLEELGHGRVAATD